MVDPARGDVLPIQVRYDDSAFLATTKPGDWYGDTIFLDRSDSPVGPWTEVEQIPVSPKCDPNDCNTYFASFTPDRIPWGQGYHLARPSQLPFPSDRLAALTTPTP